MATVTKYVCDACRKEVADTYLEAGWLKVSGTITRSWGVRKNGPNGDGQSDFLNGGDFCSIECLTKALDAKRPATAPQPPQLVQEPPADVPPALSAWERVNADDPDDKIQKLFEWRDRTTDRYGEDLASLLVYEFGAHHTHERTVPPEHQEGLQAFRALDEREQLRRARIFAEAPGKPV